MTYSEVVDGRVQYHSIRTDQKESSQGNAFVFY